MCKRANSVPHVDLKFDLNCDVFWIVIILIKKKVLKILYFSVTQKMATSAMQRNLDRRLDAEKIEIEDEVYIIFMPTASKS